LKKDIFISYSSKDQEWADAICEMLEKDGLNCWIAHRDIKPGEDWADSINKAIKNSSIFVLVFSNNSNQSVQVAKELTLAVNNRNVIIPFKVDSCQPSGSLEYYLSDTHWMVASKEKENALIDLKEVVLSTLGSKNNKSQREKQDVPIKESKVFIFCKHEFNAAQKKKMDIAFIILALVQILFGFIYNATVLPYVNSAGNPIFNYFLLAILVPVSIGFMYLFSKRETQPMFRLLGVLVVFMPILLICRVLTLELQNNIIIDFVKNLIFISLFMPTYISILLKYNKVKYASMWLPLLIIPYSGLAYFVGGVKLAFVTMASLTFTTILCVVKKMFSDKTASMKSILVVVTSMLFSSVLVLSVNSDNALKFMEFLNPANFENTSPILDIMKNLDFIAYDVNSTTLSNVSSIYSYTYTHILDVFGLIVLVLILLAQVSCGVLLIIRSITVNKGHESVVGVLFGSLFILQMVMGFASSFVMIPLANFGAPLITCKGFEYGFVGLVYYIGRIMPERRGDSGIMDYLKKSAIFMKNLVFPSDDE